MAIKKVFNTIKFVLFTLLSLVLVFGAVIVTILNTYKPVVKAYIDKNFIGYFSTEQHFDEVYNELVSEKQNVDSDVKVYLESEPTFETSYVRESLLETQDIYSNLRSQVRTEYTIYNLLVNEEKKMTFSSKDEVNKYAEQLKEQVPKLNVKISPEKIAELGDITNIEQANKIAEEIISKNKPKKPATTNNNWKWNYGNVSTNMNQVSLSEGGVWPTVTRYISSYYGWRWGTIHTGTDIAGKYADPIYAYKSGTVTYSGWANSYGYIVKINHGNGLSTWYAHNSKLLVKAGQNVSQGETIALMGSTGFSTGNHLHFEVRINGVHVNSYPYIVGK